MTEKIEVGDIRGDLVSVGDRIAYATRAGSSASLTVGTIIEIVPAKKAPQHSHRTVTPMKLRIQCEHESNGWPPERPVLIEVHHKRFVKVGQ